LACGLYAGSALGAVGGRAADLLLRRGGRTRPGFGCGVRAGGPVVCAPRVLSWTGWRSCAVCSGSSFLEWYNGPIAALMWTWCRRGTGVGAGRVRVILARRGRVVAADSSGIVRSLGLRAAMMVLPRAASWGAGDLIALPPKAVGGTWGGCARESALVFDSLTQGLGRTAESRKEIAANKEAGGRVRSRPRVLAKGPTSISSASATT